jgi:hypothetical protein
MAESGKWAYDFAITGRIVLLADPIGQTASARDPQANRLKAISERTKGALAAEKHRRTTMTKAMRKAASEATVERAKALAARSRTHGRRATGGRRHVVPSHCSGPK